MTLLEMRESLRIAATTEHDDRLIRLIKAARQKTERDARRAWIKQTWVTKLDYNFPIGQDYMDLPMPPVLSGSTVTVAYVTSTGTPTWSSTNYTLDTNRDPGVIFTNFGVTWPETQDIPNAVTITSIHGYSTDADGVPEDAKLAIKMLVDDWFCHGGIDGPLNTTNYDSLISTLRWGDYR